MEGFQILSRTRYSPSCIPGSQVHPNSPKKGRLTYFFFPHSLKSLIPSIYFPFTFLLISHSATKGKVHPPTVLLPDSFLIIDLQSRPQLSGGCFTCLQFRLFFPLAGSGLQGCLPPGSAWTLGSSAGQEPPHTPRLARRLLGNRDSRIKSRSCSYYCQWYLNTFESMAALRSIRRQV